MRALSSSSGMAIISALHEAMLLVRRGGLAGQTAARSRFRAKKSLVRGEAEGGDEGGEEGEDGGDSLEAEASWRPKGLKRMDFGLTRASAVTESEANSQLNEHTRLGRVSLRRKVWLT